MEFADSQVVATITVVIKDDVLYEVRAVHAHGHSIGRPPKQMHAASNLSILVILSIQSIGFNPHVILVLYSKSRDSQVACLLA